MVLFPAFRRHFLTARHCFVNRVFDGAISFLEVFLSVSNSVFKSGPLCCQQKEQELNAASVRKRTFLGSR